MSTAILTSTSFVGLDIAITRKPMWETRQQENVSGKETRVALRTVPRWTWDANFNFLRNNTFPGFGSSAEYAAFIDFYNNRAGGFDSFQWQDPEDFSATAQTLSFVSAGVYQLQRTLGTFYEPIYAPSALAAVTITGSSGSTAGASVTGWGTSSNPGTVTLSTATPSSATAVFASFSYYWPARFDQDSIKFQRVVSGLWELKGISWTSIV